MKETVKLTFDIAPVAQARPRATRFGRGIKLYDPKPTKIFKQTLRQLAKAKYREKPLNGQIKMELKFYRPVQKGLSKKERHLRLIGTHRPTVRPDIDNYTKSALDALNGVLFEDDAQIVSLSLGKYYSEKPRIEIKMAEFEEDLSNE